MLTFCPDPVSARTWCADARHKGLNIGLVPTMGALHDGHLTLVDQAVRENDLCIASIFVNPLQFNETQDFSAYPRDLESDREMLEARGCDMVFTGSLGEFFPDADSEQDITLLDAGPYAAGLEAEHRPGHFEGVRTIVERLFLTTTPTRAYFGEKDFQQTLVVKDLARAMGFPEIRVCATQRESDGLAMSSRNRRLTEANRAEANVIYQALCAARESWEAGERDPDELCRRMMRVLCHSPFEVEYAEVRDPFAWTHLRPPGPLKYAQALIAVRAGDVRLIDNLQLHSGK